MCTQGSTRGCGVTGERTMRFPRRTARKNKRPFGAAPPAARQGDTSEVFYRASVLTGLPPRFHEQAPQAACGVLLEVVEVRQIPGLRASSEDREAGLATVHAETPTAWALLTYGTSVSATFPSVRSVPRL
jgi:hypothetical protein